MKIKRKQAAKTAKQREIHDYDRQDTTSFIDPKTPLYFEDLDLQLPKVPPTQVISIRLPSHLLNQLKAISSQQDIPYQGLIKFMLSESLAQYKRKQ